MATGATVPGGWFVAGGPDLLTGYVDDYSYNRHRSPGPVLVRHQTARKQHRPAISDDRAGVVLGGSGQS